jgi:hypothetical protein
MQNDLIINLPQGTGLHVLQISASSDIYDEVLQRAVMLLLTSDTSELLVDDRTPLQLITEATTGGVGGLNDISGHYADALRRMLNSDENVVEQVDIEFSVGNGIVMNINITKPDTTEISGEFTL